MDQRLQQILESMLHNIETLNEEVSRLNRSEQFTPASPCFHLIDRVRSACLHSLQNMRTIEDLLRKKRAEIFETVRNAVQE